MHPTRRPSATIVTPRPHRVVRTERVTPQLPEWQENLIRAFAIFALLFGCYWITWRWTSTINTSPEAIVPSILLLLAETWAIINMAFFIFMTWRIKDREPGEPIPGRSVDIFITTYDEPLEVIRRTAVGAKAVRYPHRTYILDDGKREDLKAMAQSLGIGYIRRTGNAHAKAGNLNHALAVTHGEFVLQLDADHVPMPQIIDRMLGYFRDPKVAVIQSPQDFYNTDSFTHVVNDDGRRLWEENRIFYSLLQAGRDHWDASFFCGSCGMLRRESLEAIGGFSTETIIEDQETTLKLHSKGWKSVYHSETLAYGLAPASAGAYHVQRLRWGQGALQMLKKLNPLTYRGLTPAQRVCYFAGLSTYFEGFQKAIFYLMPLFYFFTGIAPIAATEQEFLIRLIPYLIVVVVAFELLARGTGYLLISERFTMVRFFTYMMAVTGYFAKKQLKFNVTPKGKSGVPFNTYSPQLVLLILSIAAPIWATLAYYNGWIDYESLGWGSTAFALNGVWALWNMYFAAFVVRHSLIMRQQREDHRFVDHLPIQFRLKRGKLAAATAMNGITQDLNQSGLSFRSSDELEMGKRLYLSLPLSTTPVEVTGKIVHVEQQETRYGRYFLYGVEFERVPVQVRDVIELHCTHHAVPIWRERYRQSIDLLQRAAEVFRNARSERRHLVQLPAQIEVELVEGGEEGPALGFAILEETSESGARLLLDQPIEPGSRVTYTVPGTSLEGTGVVRFVKALETPMAIRYAVGIELDPDPALGGGWMQRFIPNRFLSHGSSAEGTQAA